MKLLLILILLFYKPISYPENLAIVTKVKGYECWAQHYRNRYYAIFDCKVQYKKGDTVNITGWKRY